jgi:predicted 3-demethylubiquinone-9 3-methyltransferase (glyoxalase superfamily)
MNERIVPCLWFDREAEEAANYYTGIFPNSRITHVARYGNVGEEIHGGKPGEVLLVTFELDGQEFTALNGGPHFKFNEAVSLQIFCNDQREVDHYWEKLGAGGDPSAQQCGWLKDRFGVSWQVSPRRVTELMASSDQAVADRVMAAILPMKKIDLAAVERAAGGG